MPRLDGLRVRFDAGWQHRRKFGFLLNAMEQTVEEDLIAMCPAGVSLHFSRMRIADDASLENLRHAAENIRAAAAVLLAGAPLDVLTYTCSSSVAVNGEERIYAILRDVRPKSILNNALDSSVRAIKHLGGHSSTLLTPYTDDINRAVRRFIEARGVAVAHVYGMGLTTNAEIDTVASGFIEEAALALADDYPADVVFICCGSLRALSVINRVEAIAGVPVVTSNQAMMWACLQDTGVPYRSSEYGALWRTR